MEEEDYSSAPTGTTVKAKGESSQRIHPGITIPYSRAPTGRTEFCRQQRPCCIDLLAPRWGADHFFNRVPGCCLAPFAFTVSPLGAKIDEKIFAFTGKTAAILSASPGGYGGARSLGFLRPFLENIKITVIADQFSLPSAHEAFGEDGGLLDAETAEKVKAIGKALSEA